MLTLTWSQAAAWRARRHYLEDRAPAGRMLEVAGRLCGVHAQVISCAELALWARVEDLDRAAVHRALWEERSLVKTWAMRGTLHLFPARELAEWHAALGTNQRFYKPAQWLKYYGITMQDLDRLTDAVAAALDGRVLTREELAREVSRISGSAASGAKLAQSSWGTILKPAAFAGSLCFGPSLGQRVRFTRPDTWLGRELERVDAAAARTAITRRYLAAYGPASFHDLARWWTGGGVSTARAWIASLGDEVVPVKVDGTQAWMLAADVAEVAGCAPNHSVRLLPAFDPHIVGASHHAANLMPAIPRARVYRPQGWMSPVLLVGGRIAGVWRHAIKGRRLEVVIEPFGKIPKRVRDEAEQEAERLAGFLGGRMSLVWAG